MDRAGHEQFARGFFAGFPDVKHDIQNVIASEDSVFVRFVLRGTHTGAFFGLPPTNKPIVVAANILMRVTDNKVSELLGVFDEAGLLRQIGVLPA
jgi:predicted ester cyclase